MPHRALILTGKLVQDHEYIYPYYRVGEEGWDLDVAVRGKQEVQGIIGTRIVPTLDVPELRVDDFDMLIIPGGAKAMEYMRQDQQMVDFVADFNAAEKVIATICHGAQMLISARIVQGRTLSGYYSIQIDIENAGATYRDDSAVVDENFVTTAHYKDLGPWMKAAFETFYARQRTRRAA